MKKQLLNESEIRKLMKFANIEPLTSGFVEKLDELRYMSEQEDEPEEEGEGVEDVEAAVPPEEDFGDEEGAEDFEDEEGAEDFEDEEGVATDTDAVLEGVKTTLEALKLGLEEMGLEEAAAAITLEVTGEEEEDFPPEEEDFPPEEEGPEPESMAPDAEADLPDLEDEEPVEEQMMQEVLGRVVKRLRGIAKPRRRRRNH